MKVVCVLRGSDQLRSSDDYDASRVARLVRQLARWAPQAELVCLSDVEVPATRVPLQSMWPGWWAKMELFAPWAPAGDFLYMDLDTTLVGGLDDIAKVRGLTLLRDFYHPQYASSGLMFLPETERARIWEVFSADPIGWICEYQSEARMQRRDGRWGDQAFLADHGFDQAQRWQDLVPGQIVSYKAHRLAANGLPPDARLICFHGVPRPWDASVAPQFAGD